MKVKIDKSMDVNLIKRKSPIIIIKKNLQEKGINWYNKNMGGMHKYISYHSS